mgnify:CR=1 FL=1
MQKYGLALLVLPLALGIAHAQNQPAGQQSLAAALQIQVFPSAGQAPSQQSQDESMCYQWAVSNTGVDPFVAEQQSEQAAQQAAQQEQQAQQATQGAGAKGALGGAAAGALIGEIADDDASKGAAYGAALGAIRGRRKAEQQSQQAQQQAEQQKQQTQQASAQQIANFKNAFSVCLEANKYMVKY